MVCSVEMLHHPGQPESSWAFKTRFSLRQKRKDNLLRQKGVFRVSRRSEKMGNLRSGSKRETKCFETTSGCLWLLEVFMEQWSFQPWRKHWPDMSWSNCIHSSMAFLTGWSSCCVSGAGGSSARCLKRHWDSAEVVVVFLKFQFVS